MGQAEAVITRLAGLDDIPAMIRISADVWDGEDYVPRVAKQWVGDPDGRLIVAECDGVVRGFGRLAMHTPTDGWLEGLRVDSSFRRHGVARVIARRLLEEAKHAAAKSLRFATSCDNIESIALNESLGFRRIAGLRYFFCDPEPLPAAVLAATSRANELAASSNARATEIEVERIHSPGSGDPFTLFRARQRWRAQEECCRPDSCSILRLRTSLRKWRKEAARSQHTMAMAGAQFSSWILHRRCGQRQGNSSSACWRETMRSAGRFCRMLSARCPDTGCGQYQAVCRAAGWSRRC